MYQSKSLRLRCYARSNVPQSSARALLSFYLCLILGVHAICALLRLILVS